MIRVIDGLPDGVLGFEASGKLTADDYTRVLAPALERRAIPGLRGVRQPDASPVEHDKATEPSESVEKSGTDGVVEPRFHRSGPTRDQDDIVLLGRRTADHAVGDVGVP